MNYEIFIEDFDFVTHYLSVKVGDIITFRLSNQVPFHAEHIIYGKSDNKALCFESDVLQIKENTYFEFVPQSPGDVYITCKIYLDMFCEINVRGDSSEEDDLRLFEESGDSFDSSEEDEEGEYSLETKQSSEQPNSSSSKREVSSILEGVAHRMIPVQNNFTSEMKFSRNEYMDENDDESSVEPNDLSAQEKASDSFYDSDDVISLDDYDNNSILFLQSLSDGVKSPLVAFNQTEIANIFDGSPNFIYGNGRKRYVQSDEPNQIQHHDLPNLPSHLVNHKQLTSTTAKTSTIVTVVVNEFSFHPKQLLCSIHDQIKFVLNDQEINQCSLCCEGEFDRIFLEKSYHPEFIYQFHTIGTHIIKNEIYNFVECKIVVQEQSLSLLLSNNFLSHEQKSPPKLYGSFPPVNQHLPKPIFNRAALQGKNDSFQDGTSMEEIRNLDFSGNGEESFTTTTMMNLYEEEEFNDVLQDLTYLNDDEGKSVQSEGFDGFEASENTKAVIDAIQAEQSFSSKGSGGGDDCTLTDPDGSLDSLTENNSLVLDVKQPSEAESANTSASKKSKRRRKRKEKANPQNKSTQPISDEQLAKTINDEQLAKTEYETNASNPLQKEMEDKEGDFSLQFYHQEKIQVSDVKSPIIKEQESYLMATADFSEDFDTLSEENEDNAAPSSPVANLQIERQADISIIPAHSPTPNFTISPVDKKAPIDENAYDENVSFDSEEEEDSELKGNDEAYNKDSKVDETFNEPSATDEELMKRIPPLISKPLSFLSLPLPLSSLATTNDDSKSTPITETTTKQEMDHIHSINTTPSSGRKTNVLLSALGLKSKSTEEQTKSSLDLLIEAAEAMAPTVSIEISSNALILSQEAEERSNTDHLEQVEANHEEFFNFLWKRYEVVQGKYSRQEHDVLPAGKQVPIIYWSALPSLNNSIDQPVDDAVNCVQTLDEDNLKVSSEEKLTSKASNSQKRKSTIRGSRGVYVPPPARVASNDSTHSVKSSSLELPPPVPPLTSKSAPTSNTTKNFSPKSTKSRMKA